MLLTLLTAVGSFPSFHSLAYALVGAGFGGILIATYFLIILTAQELVRHTQIDSTATRRMLLTITVPLAFVFLLNITFIIMHRL